MHLSKGPNGRSPRRLSDETTAGVDEATLKQVVDKAVEDTQGSAIQNRVDNQVPSLLTTALQTTTIPAANVLLDVTGANEVARATVGLINANTDPTSTAVTLTQFARHMLDVGTSASSQPGTLDQSQQSAGTHGRVKVGVNGDPSMRTFYYQFSDGYFFVSNHVHSNSSTTEVIEFELPNTASVGDVTIQQWEPFFNIYVDVTFGIVTAGNMHTATLSPPYRSQGVNLRVNFAN